MRSTFRFTVLLALVATPSLAQAQTALRSAPTPTVSALAGGGAGRWIPSTFNQTRQARPLSSPLASRGNLAASPVPTVETRQLSKLNALVRWINPTPDASRPPKVVYKDRLMTGPDGSQVRVRSLAPFATARNFAISSMISGVGALPAALAGSGLEISLGNAFNRNKTLGTSMKDAALYGFEVLGRCLATAGRSAFITGAALMAGTAQALQR